MAHVPGRIPPTPAVQYCDPGVRRLFVRFAFFVVLVGVISLSTAALVDGERKECKNPSPELRIQGCTALIDSGRYEPDDVAWFYYNRGTAYSEQGKSQLAIADYDRAIALESGDARIFFNRGLEHFKNFNRGIEHTKNGDSVRALADFTRAIELDPEKTEAYFNRGTIYFNNEEYDQSIKDLDRAIALNPNHADAYVNRGSAYRGKGNNEQAVSDFNKAIALEPRDALAYGKRGLSYHELGKIELAIADYRMSLKLMPPGDLSDALRRQLDHMTGAN